ncbi:MAG: hypothetical protein GY942_25670 [Aestuariibacter sp.]|nr:hypothetical protein [Aestuariibacter sp.]
MLLSIKPNPALLLVVTFLLATVSTVTLYSAPVLAEHRDVAPLNPAVGEYFKYRDNRQAFQQIRASLVRHIIETKQLLPHLERSVENKTSSEANKRSVVDAQLDSKLVELNQFKQTLTKLREKRSAKLAHKSLESSIEIKIEGFARQLRAIKTADNKASKRQAIQSLKAELKRYQAIKRRDNTRIKAPQQPNGWSSKPIPPPIEVDPGDIPTDKSTQLFSPPTRNTNIAGATPDSANTNPPVWSAKTLAVNTLKAIVDLLIPQAAAQDYQQPVLLSGVAACYDGPADYDANINADLDLSQAELEVDEMLDANAYQQITALAAQLDYSPVKILEYTTNNLEHEHYRGSVKGALGVLESGGGNDVDHASLLSALLRTSSTPTRYVRGYIYLQDKPEHLNWWNVKDLAAANSAVGGANKLHSSSSFTVDGDSAFYMEHVWVEACVPYGNYRGDDQGTESHRWVALDASFKHYDRIDGITQNEVFDYDAFLSERTKTMPHEEFETQVLAYARSVDPNLTLADIGSHWQQKNITLDFLPDNLPYAIRSYNNWSDSITTPKSAVLPDDWRAIVRIYFAADAAFDIPMTDFAQHRITLSFEGDNSSAATSYLEFMDGDRILDCDTNNLPVKPVFRKDGVALTGLDLSTLELCEADENDNLDYRKITMGVAVRVNNKVVSVTALNGDPLTFDTISPLNYYALSAYPFNASDRFIQTRNQRLLTSLNSSSKPSDNADETIGEFLNIVLLKYMRYITDAGASVGQLSGTTGRSGHHIGLTSTHADVEYIFDLPYAMHSNNFVVDVPGGLSRSVTIEGGALNFDAVRLVGYTASHYESYVWQENALKDAVSTVSGLQIAAVNNNPVQSFTTGASLSAFVNTCTDLPDMSTWASSKSLASMVAELRAAGQHNDDSLKSFFVSNINYFTSYTTEVQIDNALAVEFALCYYQDRINYILSKSFPSGFANKVTIPQEPVSYRGWMGPVYATESIRDDGSGADFGFPISSFSGGYTVPTIDPIIYSAPTNNSPSYYSTGYDIPDTISFTLDEDYSTDSIFSVNSAVGDGVSTYGTTAFDPVNMVTGNMYHNETDIGLASRGLPLLFKRTYNSRNPEDGPLGWGWTHSLNQTLEFVDTDNSGKANTIIWTNGTGSTKYIDLAASTAVVGGVLNITSDKVSVPDGFYFQLQRPHSGGSAQEIEITEKSGITYHFQAVNGSDGDIARFTRITDRNGHSINLGYSGTKLTTVTDPDNRVISLTYYPNTNRIHTITLNWDGTVHEYFYDASGNLSAYRNPLDRDKGIDSSNYSYYSESDGHNLNHRLESFAYANGYQMTFDYYVNGKAYRHYNAEGETATFTYNDFRREATTVDELGRQQRYIFNKDGLPVEITDTLGGKEIYAYEDPNDPMLRTSVISAMGYETQYSYDTNGNLTSQTMPSGDTVTFAHYNAFGQPQLIKNALGNYTLKRYNGNGNLTDTLAFKAGFGASINPATFNPGTNSTQILSWTQLEYDSNGKLERRRQIKDFSDDTTGPYTEFDYTDSANNTEGVTPTSVSYFGDVDGDGSISPNEGLGTYSSQYDTQGRLISGFNSALYPVNYRYDTAGHLIEGTDSLGGTRTFNYDASGLLTGQSLLASTNGQVALVDNSVIMYDNVNRRIATTDASGAISNLEYDDAGNLKKATSPDGYSIFFDYDAKNRVTTAYDEEGNTVERKLDLIGRVKQLINPNGDITDYSYYGPEQNGRVQRITDAENRWTEFDYNAAGQVTRVLDNAGRETLSDYDAIGRVVRVVSPEFTDSVLGDIRPVTTYEYNSLGHQTHVYAGYTNAAGEATADSVGLEARNEYDDFGRLLKKFDAANNQWQITEYDVHGNVLASSDPLLQITTASYGFGGVLENQSTTGPGGVSAGTESIAYERNALGQPETITSANLAYGYQYDTAHRLEKVTDSRGGNFVEYDYSIGGMLNSITDNHGNKTAYLYDPVGRLTGIRTPDKGLISYVYDAGGRLQQKVFPNDLVTAYQYFKDNRVKSIATTDGSGSELIRHDYTYNSAGDAETASHSLSGDSQTRRYEYDGLGRLTKERDITNIIDLDQITYDPYGNRRQRTVDGQTYFYSHNNLHQITEIRQGSSGGSVIASFTYDDNGNMTGKTYEGITTTIGYDALDRVNSVGKTGLASEQYAYDHGIRRIQKTVGGVATNYHYSGPDIIGEYNGGNWSTTQAVYAHGAAMDDPLLRLAANDPRYYHGDVLGSVVGMSDNTGALTATNRYDAWGNVTASTGTTAQYGYTGREPNANGLIYYRSRYYDPQIGRFTQPDPKGFIDGINRYTYVLNSPVNYVDPWGMSASTPTVVADSGGYYDIGGSVGISDFSATEFLGGAYEMSPITQALNAVMEGGSDWAVDMDIETGTNIPSTLMIGVIAAADFLDPGKKAKVAGNVVEGVAKSVNKAPDFIVSKGGTAFPVPKGSTGPTFVVNSSGKTTGSAFTGGKGGANGQVDTMRIMDATPARGKSPGYPNGYVKYENKYGQGVNPSTGKTISNKESHFPLD